MQRTWARALTSCHFCLFRKNNSFDTVRGTTQCQLSSSRQKRIGDLQDLKWTSPPTPLQFNLEPGPPKGDSPEIDGLSGYNMLTRGAPSHGATDPARFLVVALCAPRFEVNENVTRAPEAGREASAAGLGQQKQVLDYAFWPFQAASTWSHGFIAVVLNLGTQSQWVVGTSYVHQLSASCRSRSFCHGVRHGPGP